MMNGEEGYGVEMRLREKGRRKVVILEGGS